MMIGGVAAATAVRSFPFRVFSFPSEIVQPYPLVLGSGLTHPFDELGLGDFIVQPMYDFYEVVARSAVQSMPLFRFSPITGVSSGL